MAEGEALKMRFFFGFFGNFGPKKCTFEGLLLSHSQLAPVLSAKSALFSTKATAIVVAFVLQKSAKFLHFSASVRFSDAKKLAPARQLSCGSKFFTSLLATKTSFLCPVMVFLANFAKNPLDF